MRKPGAPSPIKGKRWYPGIRRRLICFGFETVSLGEIPGPRTSEDVRVLPDIQDPAAGPAIWTMRRAASSGEFEAGRTLILSGPTPLSALIRTGAPGNSKVCPEQHRDS